MFAARSGPATIVSYHCFVTDALESNKELVRRLIDRGFNRGDLDVVDEIVDPDVVTHNPIILDAPPGPDSVRGGIAMIRSWPRAGAWRTGSTSCNSSASSRRTTSWRPG